LTGPARVAAAALAAARVIVAPARIGAAPCPGDAGQRAAAVRARLDQQRRAAFRWRVGWAIGFGAASVGQLALDEAGWNPFGTYDDGARQSYRVGALKSTIGLAARIVIPMRVPRPPVTGDGCVDLAAAEAARQVAARGQRRSFWLNHVGGLALNLAASAYLVHAASWEDAAISFGIGWSVGLVSVYTMPRGAWRDQRTSVEWQVTPVTGAGVRGVAVVGSF